MTPDRQPISTTSAITQGSQSYVTKDPSSTAMKRTHLGITIRWSVQRLPMAARPRLTSVSTASLLILVGGA